MLRIESIEVAPDTVHARVRVTEDALRTSSSPGFSERALALLPGLVRHACENGSPRGIASELADTETPHALEHVAFELMALAGSPRTLRGETSWDFARDGRGVFEVLLQFDDDLVALGALKEGAAVVEWLLAPTPEAPDVGAAVQRLADVRASHDGRAATIG